MDTFDFAKVVGPSPSSGPLAPLRHPWVLPFRLPFCAGDDRCHGSPPLAGDQNTQSAVRNQCCFLPGPSSGGPQWLLTPQRLALFVFTCLFDQHTTPRCTLLEIRRHLLCPRIPVVNAPQHEAVEFVLQSRLLRCTMPLVLPAADAEGDSQGQRRCRLPLTGLTESRFTRATYISYYTTTVHCRCDHLFRENKHVEPRLPHHGLLFF